MIIPKKNRHEICKYLFQEGVLYAKKDYNLAKHPLIDVPNLHVIKLMQSFKSKEYVRETFAWQHYYWYPTNDGIEYLRTYLNLPPRSSLRRLRNRRSPPPAPSDPVPGGPPRFEGDRPRFGDRDGYRGGPRGALVIFGATRVALLLSSSHHLGVLVRGLGLAAAQAVLVLVLHHPPWSNVLNSLDLSADELFANCVLG
uniref:Plectin/eS10 N-terminal domain-containing protein n=1 Tax=Ananas comosus var. bracteatus TaxID=296719 RepID=A0A6V7Q1N6_ANACO|nr:unnamed protein product [Ananas comosus var. bracteatus]